MCHEIIDDRMTSDCIACVDWKCRAARHSAYRAGPAGGFLLRSHSAERASAQRCHPSSRSQFLLPADRPEPLQPGRPGVQEMHAEPRLSLLVATRLRQRFAPSRPVVRLRPVARPVAVAAAASRAGSCGNEYTDKSYMVRARSMSEQKDRPSLGFGERHDDQTNISVVSDDNHCSDHPDG